MMNNCEQLGGIFARDCVIKNPRKFDVLTGPFQYQIILLSGSL